VGALSLPVGTSVDAATPPQATQAAGAVDFVRDVQPIFRESCYGCHGPSQQMNGLRLDRRRDALRGGTVTVIGPGNSTGSRLYQRLIGNHFGPQMPPTGALRAEQIATVKAWIDQGAAWPDEAAGEEAIAPLNPDAVRLASLIRDGDARAVRRLLARDSTLANGRAHGGATPLMFAALYGDLNLLRDMLKGGANANARNDAGATALMWAVSDLARTRLLVEHGADVNVRSADGRTALMIAAGLHNGTETVKLLLAASADVNVVGPSLYGPTTALTEAAMIGNEVAFKLLVDAGANLTAGPAALGLALRAGCMPCADTLMKAYPPPLLTGTMFAGVPPTGPALGTPMFLERGANASARDAEGRTLLMLAAASEAMPVDAIKALLSRNVNVNERSPAGETALSLARRHGESTIVKLLLDAGATDEPVPSAPAPSPAASVRQAIERAVPLLQRSDVAFFKKSGCVSCHNNSLTPSVLEGAKKIGVRVDDGIAADQLQKIGGYLESWRERALQGVSIPGQADTVSYIMFGLGTGKYPADFATDAHALLIARGQSADGRWRIFANRPPIESSDLQVTALSMRALQMYTPRGRKAEFAAVFDAASTWLRAATARTTEERAFQLLGLHWSRSSRTQIDQVGRALLAEQRTDGGWSQLPTLASDAYATGQALYALAESGAMSPTSPAYQRGVDYLRKTQLGDGSWFVRTRAIAIQPVFDADFPHGRDAFISAAATNWATLALSFAAKGTS
jgi:ankyrin repeat protein